MFVIEVPGERRGGAERAGRLGVRLMKGESESGCGWREGVDIWCDSGNDGNIKATKEATLADSQSPNSTIRPYVIRALSRAHRFVVVWRRRMIATSVTIATALFVTSASPSNVKKAAVGTGRDNKRM